MSYVQKINKSLFVLLNTIALTQWGCGDGVDRQKNFDANTFIGIEAPATSACLESITLAGSCDSKVEGLYIKVQDQSITCGDSGRWSSAPVSLSSVLNRITVKWGDAFGRSSETTFEVNRAGYELSSISIGDGHSCVVLKGGSVKCFGRNSRSQLGASVATRANIGDQPGEMSLLKAINFEDFLNQYDRMNESQRTTVRATAVAAGGSFSCVLMESGMIRCVGDNERGQAGLEYGAKNIGSAGFSFGGTIGTPDLDEVSSPYLKVDLRGAKATAIDAGGGHMCAILENGQLKCWGANEFGQLGIDTNSNQAVSPDDGESMKTLPYINIVSQADKVLQVSAGGDYAEAGGAAQVVPAHTCAIIGSSEKGKVKCWGDNSEGQIGQPSSIAGAGAVVGPNNISMANLGALNLGFLSTQVEAGAYHTCALSEDGRVKCFGKNDFGQLGISKSTQNIFEVASANFLNFGSSTKVIRLAAGKNHTCALMSDYQVRCWGDNSRGQLGQDSSRSDLDDLSQAKAVSLGEGRSALHIAAGGNQTCAILDNGDVKCWGANESGQLGQDNFADAGNASTAVSTLKPIYLGIDAKAKYLCGQ